MGEVVLAEDVVGSAWGMLARTLLFVRRMEKGRMLGRVMRRDVPDQRPPIRHRPHSAYGPAHAGELEGARGLEERLVETVFVDCAVSSVFVSKSFSPLVNPA